MPFQANWLEQLLFFQTSLGPKPVLDIWGALALPVVQAALELGIFPVLRQQPVTADELAAQVGIDARGASMLLPVLESLGYVTSRDGRYRLSATTEKWLMSDEGINFSSGFAFWSAAIPQLWHNLGDSLRTGEPPINLYAWIENQPEISQRFQEWMVVIANYTMPEVVQRIKLPVGAKRLLDVGGGHGLYAMGFCEKYLSLKATVVDSPRALESAQVHIANKEMVERVNTLVGNFLQDDLPTGFDVVLLFNVIHGLSMQENAAVVQKCMDALLPKGKLLIMEQLVGGGLGPMTTGINRLLGLNYYHLLGGQNYAYTDVVTWLAAAGCADVKQVNLRKAPGVSIIVASKK